MKIPKPPVVCKTDEVETYIAPPPPAKGRIIGLDCHPDTFTAAVFRGSTPHDAVKISNHPDMGFEKMLAWATKEFTRADLFLMEAGTNSFEVCRRLQALGLRAVVMESAHVGKHSKTYADNDKMAAARITLVYLAGNAPCVWQPDETTRQRRELLHAYRKVVSDHTAAVNTLRSFLSQWAIRLGSRNPELEKTHEWILSERDWSLLQRDLLSDYFSNLRYQSERRKSHFRLIARQVGGDSLMLRCMKLLGIGMVNAFALLAVIGDVRRFLDPAKLVAYVGLNPGQRESGRGKNIKLGVGKRGRGDLRHLLIQASQAVLGKGRATPTGQWGWKLIARKGQRNVAVVAVARKLLVQVWHLLVGNPPIALEADKSLTMKLEKLAFALGGDLRERLSLPSGIIACVAHFRALICMPPAKATA